MRTRGKGRGSPARCSGRGVRGGRGGLRKRDERTAKAAIPGLPAEPATAGEETARESWSERERHGSSPTRRDAERDRAWIRRRRFPRESRRRAEGEVERLPLRLARGSRRQRRAGRQNEARRCATPLREQQRPAACGERRRDSIRRT